SSLFLQPPILATAHATELEISPFAFSFRHVGVVESRRFLESIRDRAWPSSRAPLRDFVPIHAKDQACVTRWILITSARHPRPPSARRRRPRPPQQPPPHSSCRGHRHLLPNS